MSFGPFPLERLPSRFSIRTACISTLTRFGSSPHVESIFLFFPDHLDALRNWKIYAGQEDSNLDRVLGTNDWRREMDAAPAGRWAETLWKLYKTQIQTLGYRHITSERISRTGDQPLYRIIYASRARIGLEIWEAVSLRASDGQLRMPFDD